MTTNLHLTDMETCYKLMRHNVLKRITLEEDRFGIEPELTAKIARRGVCIYEVSVCYHGRNYAVGKKINWCDGFRAIWCLAKYGLLAKGVSRAYPRTHSRLSQLELAFLRASHVPILLFDSAPVAAWTLSR